jgi:hypothetical protein
MESRVAGKVSMQTGFDGHGVAPADRWIEKPGPELF